MPNHSELRSQASRAYERIALSQEAMRRDREGTSRLIFGRRRCEMTQRLGQWMGVATTLAVVWLAGTTALGQAPTAPVKTEASAKAAPAPKTAWGEPDLQGIWTD